MRVRMRLRARARVRLRARARVRVRARVKVRVRVRVRVRLLALRRSSLLRLSTARLQREAPRALLLLAVAAHGVPDEWVVRELSAPD